MRIVIRGFQEVKASTNGEKKEVEVGLPLDPLPLPFEVGARTEESSERALS